MDTPDPDTGPALLAPGQEHGAHQEAPADAPSAPPEPVADEAGGAAEDEEVEPAVAAPSVVAVVVTSDPGAGLEDAVASLAAQEYPALSVLVLDSGSADDPTPRIAATMPHAFVRRLPANVGFAAAANDVITTVEGATFLLFCHDDVVLAPDAVRIMVEEAYRSNAGIVGPKLVDYDDPNVLLEVGMAVDHYGVPFSAIEPGEVDQEQHDAVRDVFFVSNAAMLVRTDLFHELGGFDEHTFPGSDDVDLCWRARLAGARVLVAPDARVRHRQATLQDARPSLRRDDHADLRAWTRGRVRVLMKAYSPLALVWVLPVAFLLNVVEAIAYVVARRPRRALALLAGWGANLRRLGDVRRARHDAQALRRVEDGEVRDLMVRGSARVRTLISYRLHAGDRLAEMSTRTRAAVSSARVRLRRGHVVLASVIVVVLAVGSRSLVLDRVPEVGQFRDWPGAGALWSTFVSSWRYAMVGADTPGPPAFGLMAVLSTVLFGDTDLARTILVAGAFPVGAWGAYRLARPLASSSMPAVVTALAYVANPVVRNAYGEGHLGPLLVYAIAPFLFNALMRAAAAGATNRARVRGVLTSTLLLAVATAVWPPAVLLALVIGVAFVLAVPFVGGLRLSLRSAGLAVAATGGAFVLLAPWSWSLIGADAASFGLLPRARLALAEVVAFQTGRAGSGLAPWGLIVAALLPLAAATGPRLAWAGRAWTLAIVSWVVAWLPARLDTTVPMPAREGVLVPAALGLALAIGLGVAAFTEELRTFHFGWRQLAAVAAALGLALPIMGLAADAAQGRWGPAADDWARRFEWMGDDAQAGGFRVLWLGDPTILPGEPHVVDGIGYLLTRDGSGDVRDLWAPPRGDAERALARAIELVRDGDTVRLGHLLAPIAVRYVAVVERAAPDSGRRAGLDARVAERLAAQLDLTVSRVERAAIVYENEHWTPRLTVVDPASVADAPAADPLATATRVDLSGGEAVHGPLSATRPAGPGTLLWAEAADDGWRAASGGSALARQDAFGWTNAFDLEARGRVDVSFDGGVNLVYAQIVVWLAVVAVWWRARPRARESQGPAR